MRLLAIVIISVCSISHAFAQKVRLHNGEWVEMRSYYATVDRIDKIVQTFGDEAYRRYSDGSVCYVGKLLYIQLGLLPQTANTNRMVVYPEYRVLDVRPDGCRIMPTEGEFSTGEIRDGFVLGLAGYSDREYKRLLMLRHVGSFTYPTVIGSSRTIPKYEMGEKISKAQYLAEMRGEPLPPSTNAPSESDSIGPDGRDKRGIKKKFDI